MLSLHMLMQDGFGAHTYSGSARDSAPFKSAPPLRHVTHTHAPLTDHTNTSRPAAPLMGCVSGAGPRYHHHDPQFLHTNTNSHLSVSVPPNPFESSSPPAAHIPPHAHTFHPHPPPSTNQATTFHSGGSSPPAAAAAFPPSPTPSTHQQLPPHASPLQRGDSLDRFRADMNSLAFSGAGGPHSQGPVPPFATTTATTSLHAAPTSARLPARYASPPHAHSSARSPGFPTLTAPSHAPTGATRFSSRPPWGEYYTPHTSHPFQPIGAAGSAHSNSGKLHAGAAAAAGTPRAPAQAHPLQQQLAGGASPVAATGAGASVSKAAARAQRSGAGAASCLVW